MDSLLKDKSTKKHVVTLTKSFKDSVSSESEEVIRKIFDNFIRPIHITRHLLGLPGKYKPSWATDFYKSPMQYGIAQAAKNEQAHHYHVGHVAYYPGKDVKYPGMVSEAILHTKVIAESDDTLKHRLVFFDSEHPNPFRCPITAYIDQEDISPS